MMDEKLEEMYAKAAEAMEGQGGFETFDNELFERAAESGIFDDTFIPEGEYLAEGDFSGEYYDEVVHRANSGGFVEGEDDVYDYYEATAEDVLIGRDPSDPLAGLVDHHIPDHYPEEEKTEELRDTKHFETSNPASGDDEGASSAFADWLENNGEEVVGAGDLAPGLKFEEVELPGPQNENEQFAATQDADM